MKKSLFSLLLSFAALTACSEKELPVDVTEAQRQGRADAEALCKANHRLESELHSALLAVKSREFEMRLNGDSIEATAYIEAFKQTLRETNSDIADKVL